MSFFNRSEALEILDVTHPAPADLRMIYEDIAACNRLLGAHTALLREIKSIKFPNSKDLLIQDIGCGNGELIRYLSTHLKPIYPNAHFLGIDCNPVILEEAQLKSNTFDNISFINIDVLNENTPKADLILLSLTLHHFSNENLPLLLERLTKNTHAIILISDLERSWLSHFLFAIFAKVFLKHSIAIADGKTSIKRGFKKKELMAFAAQLPQHHHQIRWKWAFRYHWVLFPKTKML